jgi:hypothetical protein
LAISGGVTLRSMVEVLLLIAGHLHTFGRASSYCVLDGLRLK